MLLTAVDPRHELVVTVHRSAYGREGSQKRPYVGPATYSGRDELKPRHPTSMTAPVLFGIVCSFAEATSPNHILCEADAWHLHLTRRVPRETLWIVQTLKPVRGNRRRVGTRFRV